MSGARVLVLDANQRSALAVTRALGASGVHVITTDCADHALAGRSRYSRQYLRCPSADAEPVQFVDWIVHAVREHAIGYLQPVTEVTAQVLIAGRERLPQGCVLPFAPIDTWRRVSNKISVLELASAAGVAAPASIACANGAALDPDRISAWPVVLKPALSRIPMGHGWHAAAVAVVHNRGELRSALHDRLEFRDHPFLIQEFIPGHGAGVFALYNRGVPLTFFAHRRIREKPPQGGVSVLCESAPVDETIRAAAQRLLDVACWHGVAMVEFRVTPEGKPYLMEVNARFWGSLQLAIDSGVNFPLLLYRSETGAQVVGPDSYRTGRRLRWFLGDLDSLYLFLRQSNVGWRRKLARMFQFVVPHPVRTRHEVFRWHDPAPGIFELREYLRALSR